jgi:4-hydroxybenzoate polyprenyltransferase
MKLIGPFLKLMRWPNLVFIAITQYLFNYGVARPLFSQAQLPFNLSNFNFFLLVLASVFIAAAGYIINDYFDVNIDKINKPTKVLVGNVIKRRWVMVWHLILSTLGIIISFYISYVVKDAYFIIGIINLICVVALWVYSTTYKRRILVGNLLISVLIAWAVLVIFCAETLYLWQVPSDVEMQYAPLFTKLFRVAALYSGFAFIITLIREVVKDLEDLEGDRREGCRTMPIVWGIPVAKTFVGVWLVVLIGILVIIQIYVVQFGWWLSATYMILAVVIPLLYFFKKLVIAHSSKDFAKLSRILKIIMLAGILSMAFFIIYTN